MDYLRGEIPVNSKVVLTTWINKIAYFLSYSADNEELIYIKDPTSSNIIVATMNGYNKGISLKVDIPTGLNSWVGATKVVGKYWASLTKQEGLFPSNTQIQPWRYPLTDVVYSFQQTGSVVNWKIQLATVSSITSGIRLVPLKLYPLKTCKETVLTIEETMDNEQKAAAGTTVPKYFTTLEGCNDGVFYTYCPAGTNCGSTCRSPCSDMSETCTLDKSSNTYSCIGRPIETDLTPVTIAVFVIAVIIISVVLFTGIWQVGTPTYNF